MRRCHCKADDWLELQTEKSNRIVFVSFAILMTFLGQDSETSFCRFPSACTGGVFLERLLKIHKRLGQKVEMVSVGDWCINLDWNRFAALNIPSLWHFN